MGEAVFRERMVGAILIQLNKISLIKFLPGIYPAWEESSGIVN